MRDRVIVVAVSTQALGEDPASLQFDVGIGKLAGSIDYPLESPPRKPA